jgi:polyisoprenoid-binding protein YceI
MKTLVFFVLLAALPASAADISGVWKVDGAIEDNPVTPTCTLKQTDAKISGNCVFDAEHAADLTGEVKGKQVTWKLTIAHEGTDYTLTFDGTLDSDSSIKGTIAVTPSDSNGDFTAKKQ